MYELPLKYNMHRGVNRSDPSYTQVHAFHAVRSRRCCLGVISSQSRCWPRRRHLGIAAPPIRRRWARTSHRGDRARRLGGPTATCAHSRSIALLRSTFAPARNRASWTTSPTPGINAPAPGRGYRSSTGSPSRSRTTAMPPRPQQQQEQRTPRPTMGRGAVVQDGTARAGTRTSPREGTRYSRPQGGTAFPSRTDVRTICEVLLRATKLKHFGDHGAAIARWAVHRGRGARSCIGRASARGRGARAR